MNVRPDRTFYTPRTADSIKTMSTATRTSTALGTPRPTLQRCLRWLAATPFVVGLYLAAAPSAQALSFTDGSPSTNPFYYDPISPGLGSSWALVQGGETPEAVVELNNSTSITFLSSGSGTDTFSSSLATQSYDILFNYTFTAETGLDLTPALAYYQICANNTCSEFTGGNFGAVGNIPLTLASGQYLRFGITNNDTFGDLTISSFNATPVPSPLPFAGLGLAALGIYRARRCKITATPK